ncbi:MAG: ABC transporter ATP-binding protein [Proteobacteria bacterium]|nr:ABC transporter ATP-binding protein [Pseudomonadota bacterium]
MTADIRKIWAILTPAERRKTAWMLVLIVLMAMAETGGVLSIMPFLSVLGRPDVIHGNALLNGVYDFFGFRSTRSFMIALGLASIVSVLVASAYKTVALHLVNRFIHLLRHSISARVLSRYLRQPYEFFLGRNTAELSRNVLSEVDQLLFNLIQPLSQLLAQGAVVLAMLVLIFWYNPVIALCIVAVVGLLYGAIYGLVRKRLVRIGMERQAADNERYQSCSEVLGGIKDVKVTQSAAAYQDKFNRASRLFSRHMASGETLAQSPLYLVEAVGYTGLIALALILMLRRGDIAHVLPALGLYGFAAYRMLPAAQIMYRGFAKLKFSSAALNTIHRDLALPDTAPDGSMEPLRLQREIRLHDVSYAYPSTPGKPVLDHFNLAIPAGASLGIAGRTGAGKSTLMDILLGLLQPQAGSLSVDGTPIDAGNATAWQRAIGYVPQHIYLADATVAENIAFGVAPDAIDTQAVERAARAAQIHDFVTDELDHGYATKIGDRGIRLSGGQRQRIGIARALYRDPPVLLMDEATSALDAQTEQALNEAIGKLSGSKTVIIIAHRQASLDGCQQIVMLEPARHPVTDGTQPAASAR